jgi:hypothetical protein
MNQSMDILTAALPFIAGALALAGFLLYPPKIRRPWAEWRIHYASFTLPSGRPSGFGGLVFCRPSRELHVFLTPRRCPPDLSCPN